jgi:23S rRNA (adenine-N6)-dimethyltransferase
VSGGRQRAALGQNLFRSDAAARRLVRAAGVRPGDLVYDLGAGTGRVTTALLAAGASVVAVELDPSLARKLAARFDGDDVRLVHSDLADIAFRPPYKVVANPPFGRTAALLKRLLFEAPAPVSASLVLQREAALKYAGARGGAASLSARPWFEAWIAGSFDRRDFVPAPGVEVAILRLDRRPEPLLGDADRAAWGAFVRWAHARPPDEARRLFRPLLSHLQWRRLSDDLAIAPDAVRNALTLDQWLGLFRFARRHAARARRRRAFGWPVSS